MENTFLIFLILAVLGIPVAALVLAIVSLSRSRRLEYELFRRDRQLDQLKTQMAQIREQLDRASAADEADEPAASGSTFENILHESASPKPQPPETLNEAARNQDESPAGDIGREGALSPSLTPAPMSEPEPEPEPEPVETETHSGQPSRQTSLEEKLGAHLPVWIGAVALSLAGIFLVRHFIEKGWINEEMRVGLAFAFGIGMIGSAQWIIRRSKNIASGLAAAGIVVLYGVVLAATRLYEFSWASPAVGFVGLALITAGAVGLSLRHGQGVALLGLAGGFLTPALLGAEKIGVVHLFGYLLMLEIGLVALSHHTAWWKLSLMTLVGGLLWAGVWSVFLFNPGQSHWVGLYLLGSVAAFVVATVRQPQMIGPWKLSALVPWASVAGGFVLVGFLLIRSETFVSVEWVHMGLLAVGTMVLASLRPAQAGLAVLGMVACLIMLIVWHTAGPIHDGGSTDSSHLSFRTVLFGYFALFAVGGYAALWFTRRSFWAGFTTASALAYAVLAQQSLGENLGMSWLAFHGLGCVSMALMTVPVLRFRDRFEESDHTLGALVFGVFAFATLAAADRWDRVPLTLFLAAEVALTALVSWKWRIRSLHALALGLGAWVTVRLLFNPHVLVDYFPSEHWLMNRIPMAYGLPLMLFLITGQLLRQDGARRLAIGLEAVGMAFGIALVTLMIRHGFHPQDMRPETQGFDFLEWGFYAIVWIATGLVALWGAGAFPQQRRILEPVGLIGLAAGAIAAAVGAGFIDNPLWVSNPVRGVMIFNELMVVFGLPAMGLGLAAVFMDRDRWPGASSAALFAALVLGFAFLSLEVRQGFQGRHLNGPRPDHVEWYVYSAVWILYAVGLLVGGVVTGNRLLRYASLMVMLVSVCKVFLFDTSHLEDLYRVLSYFGLGVSLLGLAYVYQRFVFTDASSGPALQQPARSG